LYTLGSYLIKINESVAIAAAHLKIDHPKAQRHNRMNIWRPLKAALMVNVGADA
jgi:hypothetical protein